VNREKLEKYIIAMKFVRGFSIGGTEECNLVATHIEQLHVDRGVRRRGRIQGEVPVSASRETVQAVRVLGDTLLDTVHVGLTDTEMEVNSVHFDTPSADRGEKATLSSTELIQEERAVIERVPLDVGILTKLLSARAERDAESGGLRDSNT
jgi:hypothetical protein